MEKFVNQTKSTREKAVKIGASAPKDSAAISWFSSDEMTPSNTVSVLDISHTIPENKISETSGMVTLAYADELGVLRKIDGSYIFKTNNITVSDLNLSQRQVSGQVQIADLNPKDFVHYKYVSKYFISAPNSFSLSSESDFLPAESLGNLSIKVLDQNGFDYIDPESGLRKYRILLEPYKTESNLSRPEVPHKVVVLFDADKPRNITLVYDKVSSDEFGNIFNQELSFSETVNAVPFYREIAEESYVIDLNNHKKNIFSIKKIDKKYNELVYSSAMDDGYQVMVSDKAFSDYRTYEVFNWRLIAKTRFSANLDEVDFGVQANNININTRTVKVGVLYSSSYQRSNSSINPYVFQRLEKSPFNLFRYNYINPLASNLTKNSDSYWKVDIDTVRSLNDFDVLAWSPDFVINNNQATKIIQFLSNNGTILLDLSRCPDARRVHSSLQMANDLVDSSYHYYNPNSPLISSYKNGAWDIITGTFSEDYYGIFGSKNTGRSGSVRYKRFKYFSNTNLEQSTSNDFIYSSTNEVTEAKSIGTIVPVYNSADRLSRGNIVAVSFPLMEYCNNIYSTSVNQEPSSYNYGSSTLDTTDTQLYSAVSEGPFKFLFNISAYAAYCKAHSNRAIDTRSAVYNFVSPWNSSWVMSSEALLQDEIDEYFTNLSIGSDQSLYGRDLMQNYSSAYDYYRREISKILPTYQVDKTSIDPEDVEIYIEVTNPDVEIFNATALTNSGDEDTNEDDVRIFNEELFSSYTLYRLNDVLQKSYAFTEKYSPLLIVPDSIGQYLVTEKSISVSGEAQLRNSFSILNTFRNYDFNLTCTYSFVSVPLEKESEFTTKFNLYATANTTATLVQPQPPIVTGGNLILIEDGVEVEQENKNNIPVLNIKSAIDDLGLFRATSTRSSNNVFPYTGDIDLGNKTSGWVSGNRGDFARYVQFTLWTYNNFYGGTRNYYPYGLDDYYGPKTRDGVKLFQRDEGARYIDGIVDSETKWLMARFWKRVFNERRDIWNSAVTYFSAFKGNGYMFAAKDAVTANQIGSGTYKKVTFTGTVGPGEAVDYIFFELPEIEKINKITIKTDPVWNDVIITEWGFASAFYDGNTSKYRRTTGQNKRPVSVSGVTNHIEINLPNLSRNLQARYGYVKVTGKKIPSKYGTRVEGFGISSITASGYKPGVSIPPKYDTNPIVITPVDDVRQAVSVEVVYDIVNIPLNVQSDGYVKVGVPKSRTIDTANVISKYNDSGYYLYFRSIKYAGRTYNINTRINRMSWYPRRNLVLSVGGGNSIEIDLSIPPSSFNNLQASLSNVYDYSGRLLWSYQGSFSSRPNPITFSSSSSQLPDGKFSSITVTAETSELYFEDAEVMTYSKPLSSGYSLMGVENNSVLYNDTRTNININDGILLLCNSDGTSFGIPTAAEVADATPDNLDSASDIRLGSFTVSDSFSSDGFIYGFYDNREKEFIGKEISYISFIDRGPENIYIGICAIDADGNTQNDNEYFGTSTDMSFVPVNVPLKYITPVFSVSVNESSSIRVGKIYDNLSKFDSWNLPIKTGAFDKLITVSGNFASENWKSRYLNQTLLAKYSTVTGLKSSWSKIYGHGNYDIIDESPVLIDELSIRSRRTPILSWNHPSDYRDSIFGVVRPEINIFIRESVSSDWVRIESSQIKDINCNTGIIKFRRPIVPSFSNLIKISYSTSNKDVLIRQVSGNPVPLNPFLDREHIQFNMPLYIYIVPQEIYKRSEEVSIQLIGNNPSSYEKIQEYSYDYPVNFTYDSSIFNYNSNNYDPFALPIAIVNVSSRPGQTLPTFVDVRTKGGGVSHDTSNYELLKYNEDILSYWDIYSALGEAYTKGGYVIIKIPEEVKNNFIDEKEIYEIISNNLTAGVAYELQDMNGNPWS